MNTVLDKPKTKKPPVLLKGLFLTILVVINFILFFGWVIVNDQVEQLVVNRTSEYAHSIAKIAAGSSAELLFRGDKLQLETLVETVAKDPFIIKATVFAEDGQVVVESSEINTQPVITNQAPAKNEFGADTHIDADTGTGTDTGTDSDSGAGTDSIHQTDLPVQINPYLPFVEAITFQGETTGWFKVVINKVKLENEFRQSFNHTKNIILLVSTLLLLFLFVVIFRFNQRVQKLVAINHRLIQINAPEIPQNNTEWMNVIYQLSQAQLYQQTQKKQLPVNITPWIESKIISSTTFCFCQFSLQEQDNEQTASCLNKAEYYLQEAIQTHGITYQGNILSGCIIPSFKSTNQEALIELIALTHLIKQLLASLPLQITMRTLIGRGDLLVLENDRAEIAGFSLSNKSLNKVNLISGLLTADEIIFINFEQVELEGIGEIQKVFEHLQFPHFKLLKIADSIQQQVNRQVNYLK